MITLALIYLLTGFMVTLFYVDPIKDPFMTTGDFIITWVINILLWPATVWEALK